MLEPEKVFPATPYKRRESRGRGQVAKSNELTSILVLIGIVVFLLLNRYAAYEHLRKITYGALQAIDNQSELAQLTTAFLLLLREAALLVGPILLVTFIIAILANVMQIGFLFSSYPVIPQWSRINPISGLKRIFSLRGLFELTKSILKIILIGYIGYITSKSDFPKLAQMANVASVSSIHVVFIRTVGNIAIKVILRSALALLFLAILDYLFQRWRYEQDIRMTREELREEIKRTEGDPEIRRRIRRVQRELSQLRMMRAVPEADAVLTNPTHLAIALKYDYETMEAPYVLAKGERRVAEQIREAAIEHNIPIIENPMLAQSLYKSVEVGEPVPMEFYQAVAEVLAYVHELTHRYEGLDAA